MRLPFTKTATPRPELAFPSLTDMDQSIELTTPSESSPASAFAAAPSPDPAIGSALSPNARNSALQLVGTIREILVGDQIRTLDTRFANLHTSIEGSVVNYLNEIATNVDTMQGTIHAEIAEIRGAIAENADQFERRSEATTADIARNSELTIALEAVLKTQTEALQREDIRIAQNLESTAMRLTSVEENVNHTVAQLQGEDALIAGALEDSVARVAAVEARLTENFERLERMEWHQSAAQDDAINGAARIVALEEELSAIKEALHRKNIAFEAGIKSALAGISSMETSFTGRIQELCDYVSATRANADAGSTRLAALEEKSEGLRIGFNTKMGELCTYVVAQVERLERQQAPHPRQAPAPTPAGAAAVVPAPVTPNTRPAASTSTPPATAAPTASAAPAPAPAPARPASNEFPSFPKFPTFPTFPTFPSHDSPNQHPQSGFRA